MPNLKICGWTLVLASVILPPFLGAQQSTDSGRSTQDQAPSKGMIENGTYKNSAIGLEFTPPQNFQLGEPEMKGSPGSGSLLISVQAFSSSDRTSARALATFYADRLSYYPEEQRTLSRYLGKIIRANQADGFKYLEDSSITNLNGVQFQRIDFIKLEVYSVCSGKDPSEICICLYLRQFESGNC